MRTIKSGLLLGLSLIWLAGAAQDLKVDTEKSTLKWVGKKVTGEHWGYIKLKDGSFTVKNNTISAGTFTIDMTTITDNDLTSPEWNQKLVGHLKSDDFFSVEKFPTSTLIITESSSFNNNEAEVKAKITIKGKTEPIIFKVVKKENTYTAVITVDRTLFDVRYGSGKFFDNLGDKAIYDDFTLEVNILTK